MKFTNVWKWLMVLGVLIGLIPSATKAQYTRTDLNSNAGGTPNVNPELINAWGLVQLGTSPIWISDNGTGFSTLYTGTGKQLGLVVVVPGAGGAQGTPTGVVGNIGGQNDFVFTNPANGKSSRAVFIFATLDGQIVAWNPGVGGTDQAGNSLATIPASFTLKAGASYTGLAIATNSKGETFLYAADDSANREIDMYNNTFERVHSFGDPEIPRNYTPYGIQEIDGPSGPQIWVTFTALNKAQGGFVDVFLYCERKFVDAAQETHADVVALDERHFLADVFAEELHQKIGFDFGAAPVFYGEGVEGERFDVEAGAGFDDDARGFGAVAVAGDARQVAALGPAAVAVHDDGDVLRQPLPVQPGIDRPLGIRV